MTTYRVYYVREYKASSGSPTRDETAHRTVDSALATIFERLSDGDAVKGWVEDQDGEVVLMSADVVERYRTRAGSK